MIKVFLAINLIAFILYGADKYQAKRGGWRVSESTLLLAALLGGGIGSYAGMKLFHHKTRKAHFAVTNAVLAVLQGCICIYLLIENGAFAPLF